MPLYNVRVMEDGKWGDWEEWDYDVSDDALADMVAYAVKNDTGEFPDEIEIEIVEFEGCGKLGCSECYPDANGLMEAVHMALLEKFGTKENG